MKKTILKMIRFSIIAVLVIILGTSCGDNIVNEVSLFEDKYISVRYDLDIVRPLDGCRCVEINDLTVEVSIDGKKFVFAKQDVRGDVGNREVLIVNGSYDNVKEFAIAIKNGDDLIRFVNRVSIIIVINRSCLSQIQNEMRDKDEPEEQIRKHRINN